MNEIEALKSVDDALGGLEDDDARRRVLKWALDRYCPALVVENPPALSRQLFAPEGRHLETSLHSSGSHELPGIALMSDSGQFQLTVRDLKAKSTNDAAIRLALVAIYAYCELTGETSVSSRRIVKPILEDWRAYTGNTRVAIAGHQGIIRSGDALTLDQHAKREAERYVREILDDSVEGQWQPSGGRNRRKTTKRSKTASDNAK